MRGSQADEKPNGKVINQSNELQTQTQSGTTQNVNETDESKGSSPHFVSGPQLLIKENNKALSANYF